MTDIKHLVCPHCHKADRVPADKLSAGGNCGACKQPLWPDQVLELKEPNFAAHTGRSDVPVLVDFWADWCSPCLIIAPVLKKMIPEYEGKVLLAKIDADENMKLCGHYKLRGFPTLILFVNGEEVVRRGGAQSGKKSRAMIDPHLPIN